MFESGATEQERESVCRAQRAVSAGIAGYKQTMGSQTAENDSAGRKCMRNCADGMLGAECRGRWDGKKTTAIARRRRFWVARCPVVEAAAVHMHYMCRCSRMGFSTYVNKGPCLRDKLLLIGWRGPRHVSRREPHHEKGPDPRKPSRKTCILSSLLPTTLEVLSATSWSCLLNC